MTYYEILAVPPDASRQAVRKAFLLLARRYKAAMLSDPSYLGPYEELEMAYQVLSDDENRRSYNRENALPPPPGRRNITAPAEDIWEQTYVFLFIAIASAGIIIAAIAAITGEMPEWVNH